MTDSHLTSAPHCIIPPTALWQAVAASDRRYILIGDGNHRDYNIPRALTVGLSYLGARKARALAMEGSLNALGKMCEIFNSASPMVRFQQLDRKMLRTFLSGFRTNWDTTPERQAAYQEVLFNQFVTARDHGLRLCPISTLNHYSTYELIPDLTVETRKRLEETEAYQLDHNGEWPAFYKLNPIMQLMDQRLMDQACELMKKKNLGMDPDRAMIIKSLASQNGRVVVFYGAGHFRGVQSTGIDGNLPAREQVYLLIVGEADLLPLIEKSSSRQPDFILRLDKNEGHVMPAAVARGLWPL